MDKSLTFKRCKLVKSIQEIGTGKKCTTTRGKIYNNNSKTFFCAYCTVYSTYTKIINFTLWNKLLMLQNREFLIFCVFINWQSARGKKSNFQVDFGQLCQLLINWQSCAFRKLMLVLVDKLTMENHVCSCSRGFHGSRQ